MKFFLGIVSIVAVFTVNGQDFHKEPATGVTANEAHGKDLRFQNGPIGDGSFEESQNLLSELDLQDSDKQDYQLNEKKGDHDRTLRRSRCKARNACVVMAGFCVTNATLCSGRLVPEGCKGTNCQCCVPGTIEAMFDNLKQELQSLKINMNISEININTELQSLKNDIHTSDSNLNTELQSLKNDINTSDSNLNTELQSIKINMNTSFSNMNSKVENQGCPEGLFYFAPSNQCFRVLNDTKRNYDTAKSACSALGLQLAQPYDPVTLRSYLVTKYGKGLYAWTWIGARGDGSYIRWQRNGQYISSSNPLWYNGQPGSSVRTTDCLWLDTYEYAWKTYPNQPYGSYSCSYSAWALCELVRE